MNSKQVIIIISLFLISCVQFESEKDKIKEAPKKPKNVILMIGDGMGISQISAGMISNDWNLALERCTDIGLIKTYSANSLITESAAGATAFATGNKTYNGAIGVGTDTAELVNIFELLYPEGYVTGLVATSSIVHATPAAFYSHEKYRKYYENIAMDLKNSKVNAFAGGGSIFFQERSDSADLIKTWEGDGSFVLVDNIEELSQNQDKRVGYLGAEDGMPRVLDGRADFLTESSQAIINRFENMNKPFMMMIEGSQIDWGGHANDGEYIRTEMLDFDKCINMVLNFAEKNGETLVIITADHETGGFSIINDNIDSLSYGFTSKQHTPSMVPVFAFGPGSEKFKGIYENTGIFDRIKSLLLAN